MDPETGGMTKVQCFRFLIWMAPSGMLCTRLTVQSVRLVSATSLAPVSSEGTGNDPMNKCSPVRSSNFMNKD